MTENCKNMMMSLRDYSTPGVLSIVGGFLIQLTAGTVLSIGNLVPYIVSYLRNRVPSQVGGGRLTTIVNNH